MNVSNHARQHDMKVYNVSDMYKGWYVGNFEPTVFKTPKFEVGLLNHRKGEQWPAHYHAIATEINLLVQGRMKIADQEIISGQIFVFEPMEVADPEFLEDCLVIVIKTPSIPGDKYIVSEHEVV